MRELVFALEYNPGCNEVADTLAAHLDVPRSTLTYRLRRAEEQLAKRHVAGGHRVERPLQL